MKREIELLPPTMPNFIQYKRPAGQRQDGVQFNEGIPVSDLSEEEANEYAELMKQTFIEHWKQKKANHS